MKNKKKLCTILSILLISTILLPILHLDIKNNINDNSISLYSNDHSDNNYNY